MSAAAAWKADRGRLFYRAMGLVGLLAILVGFFTTYTGPMLERRYEGPWWGHVHGALSLSWVLLFLVQASLVPRFSRLHRRLGWAALALLPSWFASTVMIQREQVLRAIARGARDEAELMTFGAIISPLAVLALAGLALAWRRDPSAHKRLMFLATVLILWPAWIRWRHYFADPEAVMTLFAFYVALAPIPLAMARDRLAYGRVHPALWWGGLFVIGEQLFEIFAFGTPAWIGAGRWLVGAMT